MMDKNVVIVRIIFIFFLMSITIFTNRSSRRSFYTQMQQLRQESRWLQFKRLSQFLTYFTFKWFTLLFIFYICLHIIGFFIIDNIVPLSTFENIEESFNKILQQLFLNTILTGSVVLLANFVTLLLYQSFLPQTEDYMRHFQIWTVITTTISILVFILVTNPNNRNRVQLQFSSMSQTIFKKCEDKLSYIAFVYVLFLVGIIAKYFVLKSNSNRLLDVTPMKRRNFTHFLFQSFVFLYIIWYM
jgi:hypothetical protein